MSLSWLMKPISLASAVALSTLAILSRKHQKARFYWHLLLYISTMGFISAWGVVISLLAAMAGQRLSIQHYVGRSFYYLASPLIGLRFEVEGEEHFDALMTARDGKHQSAVLLGNHQSFLDILYLGRIFPRRASIMAKRELKYTPFLGQFMLLSGTVFVNRQNKIDAVKALDIAGQDMKRKGVSLWVFPEGTRSSSVESTLLPFKKGAFHLAIQAQIPVVPVVFLPPIPTTGLTSDDVTSLTESTRELMIKTLCEISAPPAPVSAALSQPSVPTDVIKPTTAAVHSNIPGSGLHQRECCRDVSTEVSDRKSVANSRASGGETTEDEMDEDAVLLKIPKDV
nr:lysophosphatidate acyltransferase [Cryptococcus depauperatus CBS 7855]